MQTNHPKPAFSLYEFWSKKSGKITTISIVVLIVLIIGSIGYMIYRSNTEVVVDQSNQGDQLTSLTANVDSLEAGSPLTLIDEFGNQSVIQNGQTAQVAPGKYTLQTILDAVLEDGNSGQVKGVKEQITVGDKENKQIKLNLKNISLDESKSAAKALNKASDVRQVLNLKPVATQTGDMGLDSNTKISYPNLVLPQSNNNNSVAAIVQPAQARYTLIDPNIQNTPSANQGNLNNNNNNNNNNSNSNSNSNNGSVNTAATGNQNSNLSNIPIQNSSTLAIATTGGQIALASGCEIGKVSFDEGGTVLKYFKACDNGQNGFYRYDLALKKETQVLPTSDASNLIKVDSSSTQNLMVWTKPELGQFGIIQGDKIEIILTNTFFTAPTFSPDGKYIIVMDNYLAPLSDQQKKDLKLSNSNQDQFGMKVRVVKVEDLLSKKDKAEFKQVGMTYYISRPIDYDFDFIYWIDAGRFMAGDSSKIFSLNGDPENKSLDNPEPGRIFVSSSGKQYRLHQNRLLNQENKVIASFVSKVYQLQNQDFYFKVGDFLFRLVEDTPVQAYSKPISSVSISNNTLTLILTDGQVVKF